MLQKNERLVLQYLCENARTTDSAIAEKIGISTQAVGKIRHKLEAEGVIEGYSVKLNPDKIGIGVISVAALQLSPSVLEHEEEFRRTITEEPHVIGCYRLWHGGAHLFAMFAFSDLHEKQRYQEAFIRKYPSVAIVNMQTSPWGVVWKDSKKDAYILHLGNEEHPAPFEEKR
jgi:DNA-binding Lrp family transcriptional regulator